MNVMGIININDREELFYGITQHRPVATIPFGGRYRIIDFVLSSMVNSGIKNIGIYTSGKHRSLFDHLRSGKDWDLDRKRDGLFIFPPESTEKDIYQGDLKCFYQNLPFLHKSKHKYVLISGGNIICNIDYRPVFKYHLSTNADITVLYKDIDDHHTDFSNGSFISKMDNNGRIIDMEINPVKPSSKRISLDMYFLEKSLLIDIIDACVSRGYYDFVKDGLLKNLGMLHVMGYPYQGYLARINSLDSYYRHSLELLKPEKRRELFHQSGSIYTKIKDEPPAKYIQDCKVANSLVGNGCIIEGTVENSILFRGVTIGKGAVVKNSIIMQRCQIKQHARVYNIIADKEVVITEGKQLQGDSNFPIYIKKMTVV